MKTMRWAGAWGLAAILTVSAALPAWANSPASNTVPKAMPSTAPSTAPESPGQDAVSPTAKISKEKALVIVSAQITIPSGYKLSNTNYRSTSWETDNASWHFVFEKTVNGRTVGSINAAVDAQTGKLINYDRNPYDSSQATAFPPKVEYGQAKEIAMKLLATMNPAEHSSTRYNSLNDELYVPQIQGNISYSFRFDRTVDGVRYLTDGITIQIDGNGELKSYQYTWHDSATFSTKKPTISQEQALAAYKKANPPFLQYVATQNPVTKKGEVALAYSYWPNSLDAVTGEVLRSEYTGYGLEKPLTEKPLAPMPSTSKDLTSEQAVAIAKKTLGIPSTAKLIAAEFNERKDDTYLQGATAVWYIHWTDSGSKTVRYSASVDAKTGTILDYNLDNNDRYTPLTKEEQAKKLTDVKLMNAAADFVKTLLPQYSHQLAFEKRVSVGESDDSARVVNYSLRRVVNGIVTDLDSLYLSVDQLTGKVLSYSSSFANVQYPTTVPKTVSADKAIELLSTSFQLSLAYLDDPSTSNKETWKERKPALLIYNRELLFYENVYLDAVSGKWVNKETGKEVIPGKMKAADLAGHPASKELQLLLDYKALDLKDGKVMPEQQVTRGEFIKMMVVALHGGNYYPTLAAGRSNTFKDVLNDSTLFAYVETAVDMGVLDPATENFKPDEALTRDEMAQLLVRALGFDKLAAKSDLFLLNVKDADQVKGKGQAAIVLTLGIMEKTADGSFAPASKVSRADAAVSFYNFLKARPTMASTPITYY
ncbi:YcdB/YcdC domain-containing protein [Gorillibacterium sp. CAU 1737]|uniref:YcdB/YcdC domain-containing protein n=1 Tax=Gorillibacterium sp. CAU 1737 TaxID=3140362 RepID=UPI0032618467